MTVYCFCCCFVIFSFNFFAPKKQSCAYTCSNSNKAKHQNREHTDIWARLYCFFTSTLNVFANFTQYCSKVFLTLLRDHSPWQSSKSRSSLENHAHVLMLKKMSTSITLRILWNETDSQATTITSSFSLKPLNLQVLRQHQLLASYNWR